MTNFFYIIGKAKSETVHSNMLAWLLNPNEGHGLGARFLERFLEKICNITASSFNDVKILTEVVTKSSLRGRQDIVIQSNNFFVCIENKIKTENHDNQLKRYYENAKDNYKEKRFVYLTPNKVKPKGEDNADWIPAGYTEILDILEKISDEKKDINQIITDYMEILKNDIRTIGEDRKADEDIVEILNDTILPEIEKMGFTLWQENNIRFDKFYSVREISEKNEKNIKKKNKMLWKNIILEKNNKYFAFEFGNPEKLAFKYGAMHKKQDKNLVWYLDWYKKDTKSIYSNNQPIPPFDETESDGDTVTFIKSKSYKELYQYLDNEKDNILKLIEIRAKNYFDN